MLDEIHAVANGINSALGDTLGVCGKVRLDLALATSSTGVSAQFLLSRIGALAQGSETIGKMDLGKLTLAPISRLQGLLNGLSSVKDNITNFTSLLESVGDPQTYDDSSGVLSGVGNNANVRAHLDALQTASDQALDTYLFLAAAARPKGIGTFAAASNTLAQKATEASKLLGKLEEQASALRQKSEQLDAQAATVAQTQGEAGTLEGRD